MSIQELGHQYNAIQKEMGRPGTSGWVSTLPTLFSSQFHKIANGTVLVQNRSELEKQILQCREDAGPWQIEEKEMIPSQDNSKCTLRYVISTEKAGKFDVIAILSSTNGRQIDSVDEVFYQIA